MMSRYQEYYQQFVQEFLACPNHEKRKELHRALSKKYHPDSNPGVDEDIFKAASNAFRDTEKGTIKSSASSRQTEHSNYDSSQTSEEGYHQHFETEAEVDAAIHYFEQKKVECQNAFLYYQSLVLRYEEEILRLQQQLDLLYQELQQYQTALFDLNQKLERSFVPSILLPIYDVYQYGKKHHPKLTQWTSFAVMACIGLGTLANPVSMLVGTCWYGITGLALEGMLGLSHQSVWHRYRTARENLTRTKYQFLSIGERSNLVSSQIASYQKHRRFVKFQKEQASNLMQSCDQNLAFWKQKKQSFHTSGNQQREEAKEEQNASQHSSSEPKTYQKKRNERGDK